MEQTLIGAVRFAGNTKLYYFKTEDATIKEGDLVAVMLKDGRLEKAIFSRYVTKTGTLPPCRIIGVI